MIDCTYIEASAGYHECMLKADDLQTFHKCGPAESNCWAYWFEWRNGNILPHTICDVTNMSITINGKALPIDIGHGPDWWRVTMKDKPAADAILHWVIVPCASTD